MRSGNRAAFEMRRALPGDASILARVMLLASRSQHERGYMDRILELPEPDILKLLTAVVRHPDQIWGRMENAFAAVADGSVIAMGTLREASGLEGFPFAAKALGEAGDSMGLDRRLIEAALKRQRELRERFRAHEAVFEDGTRLVEYLAVLPESRSKGAGRALMERMIGETAAARGRCVQLYCEIGNTPAEKLYASLGFQVAEETVHPPELQHLGLGVRRLRLALV
jgi:GNAT superfamily N-acetyltransferase